VTMKKKTKKAMSESHFSVYLVWTFIFFSQMLSRPQGRTGTGWKECGNRSPLRDITGSVHNQDGTRRFTDPSTPPLDARSAPQVSSSSDSSSDSDDIAVRIPKPATVDELESRRLEDLKTETRETARRFPFLGDFPKARVR
jgi:hypothetical protein